ncbi:MAG: adenylate/guanylate cyclase domain-containing protein [Flavobacteriaceae bacterium]|nr:adenylate/guanylate cyclase domain-containing protein [Flavobacteriaceae bacterium]MBD09746.1 adenylate/guanylate cyclase domain-containing protein [Flavobacteriaceae bacterium]|tara:strand:- start:3818 stop:5662 length:1845 start_codon:yes stop_codon:yes gene_type:complete
MLENFYTFREKYNAIIISLLLCLSFQICFCQGNLDLNQQKVEKLKEKYKALSDIKEIRRILTIISQDETNPEEKLIYSELLIKSTEYESKKELITKDSLLYFRSTGFLQKGNALQLLGEFHEAIEAYFKCIEIAENDVNNSLAGSTIVSIADTYSMIGNSESAEKYYVRAIELLRKDKDTVNLATALMNAGDEYYKTEQYDKALRHFAESGEIFEKLDYEIGKAYNMGNTGMVYAKQGKDELAKDYMNEAIEILEANEEYYPISEFLNYISDIYQEQQNFEAATEYANKSLELATKHKLKDQISNANLQLSELMQNSGNYKEALERYIQHDIYQDSIINLENVQNMANLEVGKKEAELKVETQKRKNQRIIIWSTVGILLLTSLLAYGLFRRHKYVKATNKIIAAEKQRSDDLLLNILPEETAKELKDKGRVEAKKYPSVTVLFTDFKGFTSYAENLSPEKLVKTIDHYFTEFDSIVEKYGLEKIKTIGDAYMAVGGLSFDEKDQAKEMIMAAKEMNAFVTKAKHDDYTDATFDIRIGINTGAVVAGVVGSKKFAYDIWGDTVNIASRMESCSEAGRINISEDTYNIVKDDFECEYRGKIAVKNRGEMKMYFVN